MRDGELDIEPAELLPELDERDTGDEEDLEAFDDRLLSSEADLEGDEERGRFRRLVPRPPLRSRSGVAPRLPRRRPLLPRFPRSPRPHPSRPTGIVRPGFRRRIVVRDAEPCICPTHGSEYVRWVQSSLNHLMGLNLLVNGVMNPATRKALRDFQQQHGLQTDGIAGPDTKRALLEARGGGPRDGTAKSTNATQPALESELFEYDAEELEAPLARPILQRGSRGASVIELQRRLTALGFTPGAADGIFGSRTESAVKSLQRSRRITADGIVGSQTWSKLYGPAPTPTAPPAPSTTSPNWSLPTEVRAAGDALTVRYDSPPAWANGANCTSYTDGAAELRRHILATFPGITSIGGYNCRANSANPSETSVHGVGRALDVMISPVNGRANSTIGDPIANWLVRNAAEIGVQYIIWNRVRWSGSRMPRVAPYGGPNPHTDHIHVELNLDGARRRTPWFQVRRVGQHEFDAESSPSSNLNIVDRTAYSPKDKRKKIRKIDEVYALVLHQSGFSRGNDTSRYDKVTGHFAILPNGTILQLHPLTAYLYASNGFNKGSVAVEFVGNFPNTNGKCYQPEKFGCHQVTIEQIQAGRGLVLHLMKTIGLTHVLAHRQSSGSRGNDPGPDIWYRVGQWAVNKHGLKDGGPGFKVQSGKAIPDSWRSWKA